MEGKEKPNIEGEQIQKEEGQKDLDELREEEPVEYKERKKGSKLPLILGIIIGLIIGIIISPYIMELFEEEEKPIWKQYEKFETGNKTIYKNDKLGVTITKYIHPYYMVDHIDVKYVDRYGSISYTAAFSTPEGLLEWILYYAELFSDNQLKWLEYLLKYIVT